MAYLLNKVVPSLVSNLPRFNQLAPKSYNLFHSLSPSVTTTTSTVEKANVGGTFTTFYRTNIRCHFPRPSERKRIKRHGWKHRMSTEAGRRILMNKILKGCHVLSH